MQYTHLLQLRPGYGRPGNLYRTMPNPNLGGSVLDYFGMGLAHNDVEMFVGAPGDTTEDGKVYIYDLRNDLLTGSIASPGSANEQFGYSIALNDQYLAISAPTGDDSKGGHVYVYNVKTHNFLFSVENPNEFGRTTVNDEFGYAIAIQDTAYGEYLVVGAPGEDDIGGVDSGAVYMFDLQNDGALVHTFTNPNFYGTVEGDRFGRSLDISDTQLVVGVPGEERLGSPHNADAGAAYVFSLEDYSLLYTLTSEATNGVNFGQSVAIDDNFIAIGSPGDKSSFGYNNSGNVFIYSTINGELLRTISNPSVYGTHENDNFGHTVNLTNGYAIITAYGEKDVSDVGSGYVYAYDADTGSLQYAFENPNATNPGSDGFGFNISGANYLVAISAPYEEESLVGSGAVYVFSIDNKGTTAFQTVPSSLATPRVVGVPLPGQELTADISGIAEPSEIESVAIQWYADGVAISGATGSSYTPTTADKYKSISYSSTITFKNTTRKSYTMRSTPTSKISGFVNSPLIFAPTSRIGSTMTINSSNLSTAGYGFGGAFLPASNKTYQWMRNGEPISGATDYSYTLSASDYKQTISAVMYVTDSEGYSTSYSMTVPTPVGTTTTTLYGVGTIPDSQHTGQLLTAGPLTANKTFTAYQWMRNGEPIPGATNYGYVLTPEDVGSDITLYGTVLDTVTGVESQWSGFQVSTPDPTPLSSFAIDGGGANTGSYLSAVLDGITGSVTGSDLTWFKDGVPIPGATGTSYQLTAGDAGSTITVGGTVLDSFGNTVPITEMVLTDAPTTPMQSTMFVSPDDPIVYHPGDTVTANVSLGNDGSVAELQWFRDGVPIAGATNQSYVLTDADVGSDISVGGVVRAPDGTLTPINEISIASPETLGNNETYGFASIRGDSYKGGILEIFTDAIGDEDGINEGTFKYQWYRNGAPITGATGKKYLVSATDVGQSITVTVTGKDSLGNKFVRPSGSPKIPGDGPSFIAGTLERWNVDAGVYGKQFKSSLVKPGYTQHVDGVNTLFDEKGITNLTTEWTLDGSVVGTGTAYTIPGGHIGESLLFTASWTDSDGANKSKSVSFGRVQDSSNGRFVGRGWLWPTVSDRGPGAQYYGYDLKAKYDFSYVWYDEYNIGLPTYKKVKRTGTVPYDYVHNQKWYRNGTLIKNGTNNYYLRKEDLGAKISLYVDLKFSQKGVTGFEADRYIDAETSPAEDKTTPSSTVQQITGSNTVGSDLNVDLGTYQLPAGATGSNTTVEWYADGEKIATDSYGTPLTLTADLVGKQISADVTYTDDQGNVGSYTIPATNATTVVPTDYVAPTGDPAMTVTPDGSSTPVVVDSSPTSTHSVGVGDTIVADPSTINVPGGVDPDGVTYEWYKDGVLIEDADGDTYIIQAGDDNSVITGKMIYSDSNGITYEVPTPSFEVGTPVNSPATGDVALNYLSIENEGDRVDSSPNIEDANGLGDFSYQWKRDGVDISGATLDYYLLTPADANTNLTCTVSFVDGARYNESVTSDPLALGQVYPTNPSANTPNTASVTITYTAGRISVEDDEIWIDQTTLSTIVDPDGVGEISYQWKRDGANIPGATADTYKLQVDDSNTTISCTLSYTDDQGYDETVNTNTVPVSTISALQDELQLYYAYLGTPTTEITLDDVQKTILMTNFDGGQANPLNNPRGFEAASETFQWYRDGDPIDLADILYYVLHPVVDSDVNLQCKVTYRNSLGDTIEALSAPVPVTIPNIYNDANNVEPVFADDGSLVNGDTAGTAIPGTILSSNIYNIYDADNAAIGMSSDPYKQWVQWYHDDYGIPGEGNPTYTVQNYDIGGTVKCIVMYLDDNGNWEIIVSAPITVNAA